MSRLPGSPAVLVIDHVVKSRDTRGLWPGGSQRKLAAITGAAYMVTELPGYELREGAEGRLRITCSKDRHGTWRKGQHVGLFHLYANGDWAIKPLDDDLSGNRRLETVRSFVMNLIEEQPGLSKRQIERDPTHPSAGTVRDRQSALAWLLKNGNIAERGGDKVGEPKHYEVIKPLERLDVLDDLTT